MHETWTMCEFPLGGDGEAGAHPADRGESSLIRVLYDFKSCLDCFLGG